MRFETKLEAHLPSYLDDFLTLCGLTGEGSEQSLITENAEAPINCADCKAIMSIANRYQNAGKPNQEATAHHYELYEVKGHNKRLIMLEGTNGNYHHLTAELEYLLLQEYDLYTLSGLYFDACRLSKLESDPPDAILIHTTYINNDAINALLEVFVRLNLKESMEILVHFDNEGHFKRLFGLYANAFIIDEDEGVLIKRRP